MTTVHLIATEAAAAASLSRELALYDLQTRRSTAASVPASDIAIVAMHDRAQALAVIKMLRAANDAGIVALTTEATPADVIALVEAGADDVVADVDALPLRVKALARRMNPPRRVVTLEGGVSYDLDRREVRVHGVVAHMSPSQEAILERLCSAPGKVFSKTALVNAAGITGKRQEGEKILDVHVSNLRLRIIRAGGGREFIATVTGQGLRAVPAVSSQAR